LYVSNKSCLDEYGIMAICKLTKTASQYTQLNIAVDCLKPTSTQGT